MLMGYGLSRSKEVDLMIDFSRMGLLEKFPAANLQPAGLSNKKKKRKIHVWAVHHTKHAVVPFVLNSTLIHY